MNDLKQTLSVITKWMEKQNVPYMLFGGLALSLYGIPRQTFDIDIKVSIDAESRKSFIEKLKGIAVIVPGNPDQFIRETGVLPLDVKGVRVDLVFGELPFEKEAIQRAQTGKVLNVPVRVSTPEDLIIQKAISVRTRDWMDIEGIVRIRKASLDWDYIFRHSIQLAEFLHQPGIFTKIEKLRHGK